MEQLAYEWIRSRRRTMSIQIEGDGRVIVRTPNSVSRREVEEFLRKKIAWILKNRKKMEEARRRKPVVTEAMRREGIEKALKLIPGRVEYYAGLMGITYGRITIREQKTRWGSCSGKGNLNFNWKLVLAPPEVLDYVVVHELAHRREMNHSAAFWRIVEQVIPDYRERRRFLKECNL